MVGLHVAVISARAQTDLSEGGLSQYQLTVQTTDRGIQQLDRPETGGQQRRVLRRSPVIWPVSPPGICSNRDT